MEKIRLNKYLSSAGYCSRRAADKLIANGAVTVDGEPATVGTRVNDGQTVRVNDEVVTPVKEQILLLVNKPRGIVCTAEKREADNIVDFLGYDKRIYPIGRLDKDSHGLLLMTNVGQLHHAITRAANGHEKEYIVTVNKPVNGAFLSKMAEGVYLPDLDYTTAPAKVTHRSKHSFSIVLTEGKNRQIRRMCQALGYTVRDLGRVRIMDFVLDGIEEGAYRPATDEEWASLKELLT